MAETQQTGRKIGRPSDYNLDHATEICELIADGMSIRQIVAQPDMPVWSTIRSWLLRHSEFQTLYARANEYAAEWEFAGISELEQQVLDGEIEPNAARVVIDSRKWRLAKMRPKVYGDHSHKTVTVEPGAGYAALLEEIDRRRPMIDVTPVEAESEPSES